jgi:hypothetical protein
MKYDLAYWKGIKVQLELLPDKPRSPDSTAPLPLAIRHAARKIEQIERKVLVRR